MAYAGRALSWRAFTPCRVRRRGWLWRPFPGRARTFSAQALHLLAPMRVVGRSVLSAHDACAGGTLWKECGSICDAAGAHTMHRPHICGRRMSVVACAARGARQHGGTHRPSPSPFACRCRCPDQQAPQQRRPRPHGSSAHICCQALKKMQASGSIPCKYTSVRLQGGQRQACIDHFLVSIYTSLCCLLLAHCAGRCGQVGQCGGCDSGAQGAECCARVQVRLAQDCERWCDCGT